MPPTSQPQNPGITAHTMAAIILSLAPLLLVSLLGSTAGAYVRASSMASGVKLHWHRTNCIALRAHSAGSDDIDDGSDLLAVQRAASNWQGAVDHCSYMRLLVREPSDAVQALKDDEVAVVWVEEDWVRGLEYSQAMIAMTKVWIINEPGHPRDAEILDADIEVNGERYRFTTTGEAGRIDLENTLTHELGHVLGLDHPCYVSLQPPDPLPEDHLGQPIGDCDDVTSAAIMAATMFPSAKAGDTAARTPEADDVAGICSIFPAADDPGVCSAEPDDNGCSYATGPGGGRRAGIAPVLLLGPVPLLLLALSLRVRRTRHGRPGR